MEELTSWRGAFGTAWGNLTGVNNEGNIRAVRWMFFLVFALGTAWAVWNYVQGQKLLTLEEFSAAPTPNLAEADKTRLDAMIQQVEVTSQMRAASPETVEILAAYLQKYPFGEPKFETVLVDVPPEEGALRGGLHPDLPPITLRGIMTMGKQNVAVMDIPGVGTGMIVKAGDTFMQRKGRIVRIATDKIVINWGGENTEIAPSFF